MPDADLRAEVDRTPALSPFELLNSLWRRKFLVVGIVVACVAISAGLSLRSQKEYSASAQLVFRDPGFARTLFGTGLFDPGADPERAAKTNVDVLSSPDVAAEARTLLRTAQPVGALRSAVSITPSSDADVATIEARASTPEDAAAVANAFADGYIAYRQRTDRATIEAAAETLRRAQATAPPAQQEELQRSITNLETLATLQTGNAEVIARAEPNADPVAPKPRRAALLGAIVGLVLGCGVALLADRLDRRVKTLEDAEDAYDGYAVIGVIPRSAGKAAPIALDGPTGEAYRMVREGLRFLQPNDGRPRCWVVTSADEDEGKSTVANHLAASLAAVDQHVTLVDADMRRSSTGEGAFDVDRDTEGLSDLLHSGEHAEGYLVGVEQQPTLSLLPSGTVPPNAADLLREDRIRAVVSELREISDVVIVDAPPLLPVADTRALLQAPEIDGVIVVARVDVTERDRAREARRILAQSGRRVLGLVVTGADGSLGSYDYGTGSRGGRRWPWRRLGR